MRMRKMTGVALAAAVFASGLTGVGTVAVTPAMAQDGVADQASILAQFKADVVGALTTGGNALTQFIAADPLFLSDPLEFINRLYAVLPEIAVENPGLVNGQSDAAAFDSLSTTISTDLAFALASLSQSKLIEPVQITDPETGEAVDVFFAVAVGSGIGSNAGRQGTTAFTNTVGTLPALTELSTEIIAAAEKGYSFSNVAAVEGEGDGPDQPEDSVEPNPSPSGSI